MKAGGKHDEVGDWSSGTESRGNREFRKVKEGEPGRVTVPGRAAG